MTDAFDRLRAALADRYAIERELGAGGMATVCLARDLKHDRKVAIGGRWRLLHGRLRSPLLRLEGIQRRQAHAATSTYVA